MKIVVNKENIEAAKKLFGITDEKQVEILMEKGLNPDALLTKKAEALATINSIVAIEGGEEVVSFESLLAKEDPLEKGLKPPGVNDPLEIKPEMLKGLTPEVLDSFAKLPELVKGIEIQNEAVETMKGQVEHLTKGIGIMKKKVRALGEDKNDPVLLKGINDSLETLTKDVQVIKDTPIPTGTNVLGMGVDFIKKAFPGNDEKTDELLKGKTVLSLSNPQHTEQVKEFLKKGFVAERDAGKGLAMYGRTAIAFDAGNRNLPEEILKDFREENIVVIP